MTATKTTKPAKDGTSAAYTQGMATESVANALTPYVYLADPTEAVAFIEPMPKAGGSVLTKASCTTSNPSYSNGTDANLSVDTIGGLRVSLIANAVGGSHNNGVSAIATSADNSKTISWLYGFNGTTWDQVQVDASKNLKVVALSSTAITNPTSTLTRPANTTAYSANDLIASSTTNTSIVVPTFTLTSGAIVPRMRLRTNVTTGWDAVNLSVNLWLGATPPTYTNGDNGAYVVTTGSSSWIAKFLGTLIQFGDGAVASFQLDGASEMAFKQPSGTTLCWDLQILNAATPISGQTFLLTPEVLN